MAKVSLIVGRALQFQNSLEYLGLTVVNITQVYAIGPKSLASVIIWSGGSLVTQKKAG